MIDLVGIEAGSGGTSVAWGEWTSFSPAAGAEASVSSETLPSPSLGRP